MKNKILVVVAHPDDEVLGMGGTLFKHVKNKDEINILFLSNGLSSRGDEADLKKRQRQAKEMAELLGVKKVFFEDMPDNQFDSVSLLQIIKKIEALSKKIKPNIVYTHHANDLNVDHRLTFEAVLTACRPQPGFWVKEILTFEVLSSTEWQYKEKKKVFCPNKYVNIDKEIDKKIRAMNIYKDEIRKFPHPRSIKGIKTLAQFRGMEVGYKYAEAFQVIRLLDD